MTLSEKLEGWNPVEPIALSLLDHIIAGHEEGADSQAANSLALKPKPLLMDEGWQQVLDSHSERFVFIINFISPWLRLETELL